MNRLQRPVLSISHAVLAVLVISVLAQLLWHHLSVRDHQHTYRSLNRPLDAATYSEMFAGSEELFSNLLAIRLQLHDNQAGKHIRYKNLDYRLLVSWLDTISEIAPNSEYPIFLASRVYSQTTDKANLRQVLEFINRSFTKNPQLFWRHQAEATVHAKHKLEDLEFALVMAKNLSRLPDTIDIPRWARDMHFLLLGELNEYETTIVIIESILKSDAIIDPDEIRFLKHKLSHFQQKLFESRQNQYELH